MVTSDWRRWVSGPALALIALGGLAAWPVLRAGYPAIGDGLIHFYRLVEFEHLLQHGAWFPRWATDLGYGYGYPLFNYYPPLTYYLGALFGALGLSNANSLLAVYLAAWLLAIGGAYRLAREQGSAAAGLIAAAAYGLAPYLYFNALARGALPETVGLGLLPWVLWAGYRLTLRPSRGLMLLGALLYAALVLTHLLTALLAIPLIVLFWLIAWRTHTAGQSITHYPLPITILLALGLSAYFLLPALLETRAVQISQLTQPGDLDFHNNFLSVADLLALPSTFDARLVFRAVPPSLSLAALALAGLGLARRAWRARRGQPALKAWDGGLWLGLIGLSWMTLPLSLIAWEHLPGMYLIQFPWRFVGPASLLLALLAARVVDVGSAEDSPPAPGVGRVSDPPLRAPPNIQRRLVPITGLALALTGLFFYSLTWTFAAGPPAPANAGVRDLAGYEQSSGQLGTTSTGEFLPVAVRLLPDPHSLEGAYALHSVIERLGPLPPGITVETQAASVTTAQAVVTAPAAAQLTFMLFDFPGWRATVDGRPAPITASQPNGLITVAVPAGRHTVEVIFGSTPLRALATALSFIAAGLLAIVASGRVGNLTPRPPSLKGKGVPVEVNRQSVDAGEGAPVELNRQAGAAGEGVTLEHAGRAGAAQGFVSTAAVAVAAIVLLGLRLAAIDGHDTMFARSRFDGERVAGVGQAFDSNFEDQLVLIGMDRPSAPLAAGATLPVTLYWRAQDQPQTDYATTLQVLDDQGNLWGQSDSQNPGGLSTSRWGSGQYARDAHRLRLRPGTPPGRYNLVAGVYRVGGAALSVLDANRVPQGQTQPLGALTVTRGQWTLASLDIAQPANLGLGPLTYLGGSVSGTGPQAGDDLTIELFWRAEGATRPDLTLHLALIGQDGHTLQQWDGPPARSDYPTGEWAAGEIVRAVQRLLVPAQAPAGPASLQLSLTGAPGLSQPVTIASLTVRVPARSFTAPPIPHGLKTSLGPVTLLGYDLDATGVTLYWQDVEMMANSYAVFVHALDAAGTIVSQVDRLPLNGARPTTSWLPGEVLADRYDLAFGSATTLELGLYDPATRQRLGTINIPLQR